MAWRQDWVDSPIEPGSQVQAWIQMWQPIGQVPHNFSRSPDRRRRSRHRHSSRGSENDSHVASAASVRQESDFNDLHEDDPAPPAVSPHGQQQREDSQRQPYFSWDSLWKSSGWWDASRPPRPTPTLVTLTHDAPRCSPPAPLPPAPLGNLEPRTPVNSAPARVVPVKAALRNPRLSPLPVKAIPPGMTLALEPILVAPVSAADVPSPSGDVTPLSVSTEQ